MRGCKQRCSIAFDFPTRPPTRVVSGGMKPSKPLRSEGLPRLMVVSFSMEARSVSLTKSVMIKPPSLSRIFSTSSTVVVAGSSTMYADGLYAGSRGGGGPTSVSGSNFFSVSAMMGMSWDKRRIDIRTIGGSYVKV